MKDALVFLRALLFTRSNKWWLTFLCARLVTRPNQWWLTFLLLYITRLIQCWKTFLLLHYITRLIQCWKAFLPLLYSCSLLRKSASVICFSLSIDYLSTLMCWWNVVQYFEHEFCMVPAFSSLLFYLIFFLLLWLHVLRIHTNLHHILHTMRWYSI